MIQLNAISYYLPEVKISNEEIVADYQKYGGPQPIPSAEDLYKQCGVRNRYRAHYDETTRDLSRRSAERLFDDWKVDRDKIDYIIMVSDALEFKGPTTACLLQNDLGLKTEVGAIDVLHGCTGFIYGLSLAKALIAIDQASNVLVITGDVPTKVIHPEDADLRAIFSDAAASTLVSRGPVQGGLNASVGEFVFGSDGTGEKNLWVERSATKEPADIEWLEPYKHLPTKLGGGRLRMNSPQIFLFALRKVPKLIDSILEKHNLQKEEIDYFVLHQANGTMLEFLRKRMKIPKEKFVLNIENVGNTVSASIPIALKDLIDAGVQPGSKVLLAGFGIGYSWGGTVLTF